MRAIIIHYHIYKNAGTSINQLLDESFKGCGGAIEALHPWSVLSPEDILHYILENDFKFVETHSGRKPLLGLEDMAIFPIFFLRHPLVERSIFNFTTSAE